MRILVIAGEYPWSENRGSRSRLLMRVLGFRQRDSIDLFSIPRQPRRKFDRPEETLGLAKIGRAARITAELVRADLSSTEVTRTT